MIWIRATGAFAAVIVTAGLISARPAWPEVPQAGPARAPQTDLQKRHVEAFLARTQLPKSAVVSIKPEIVVGLRSSKSSWSPSEKIRLQGEVIEDTAADQLGYRSMHSLIEVNCETRRDRVLEMEVFPLPNLKGQGQKRTLPGGWVQPSEDAYMADVIRAICKRPVVAVASLPPGPAPKVEIDKPKVAPPAAPPTPIPASPPVRGVAEFTLQVGALDTETAANATLTKFANLGGGTLPSRVEIVTLGTRTYYRALIAGFFDRQDAESYCVKVRAQRGPCLIRRN